MIFVSQPSDEPAMMCNRTDKPYEIVCEPSTSDDAISSHRANGETTSLLVGRSVSRQLDNDTTTSPSSTKRALSSEDRSGLSIKKVKVEEKEEDQGSDPSSSSKKNVAHDKQCGNIESTDDEKITHYTDKDVLSGRGGGTNLHPGNRFYRELILSSRSSYDDAAKSMKPEISRNIVEQVRKRGGRFLRKDKDGTYREIGETAAKEKTSQALRHRTFELRNVEDPNRVKMGGRRKQQTAERSGPKSDIEEGPTSRASRFCPPSLPPSTASASGRDYLFSSDASASLMLHGPRLKLREDAVDDTNDFKKLLLHRQLEMPSSSLSLRPDDVSYQRALASLRHREAMLNLDKAIHEEEMRRRISSMNSTLSSSFPSTFRRNLSTNLHGTILPTVGQSSLDSLFSTRTGATGMAVGRASSSSPLGGSMSPGLSLRANFMRTDLPFPPLISSSPMPGLLSPPISLQAMHQYSTVGSPGDRATLERLMVRSNSHQGQGQHPFR